MLPGLGSSTGVYQVMYSMTDFSGFPVGLLGHRGQNVLIYAGENMQFHHKGHWPTLLKPLWKKAQWKMCTMLVYKDRSVFYGTVLEDTLLIDFCEVI